MRSNVEYVTRNGMTVSGYTYVELYSTLSPVGVMCLVICSNVQYEYMARNAKSRVFKCAWFASHLSKNTLDSEWLVTLSRPLEPG
jgi:hypothetical protein